MLVSPDRVKTDPYYLKWIPGFELFGFVVIEAAPKIEAWNTWEKPKVNSLEFISHTALLDGVEAAVVPVFVNYKHVPYWFDGEKEEDLSKPAIAFFKGSDDSSYALRFEDYQERDEFLEFGSDLGFLKLIWQN